MPGANWHPASCTLGRDSVPAEVGALNRVNSLLPQATLNYLETGRDSGCQRLEAIGSEYYYDSF